MNVESKDMATLVGGGKLRPGAVQEALSLAPQLFAADGGADAILALGLTPRAVIGDMDSISEQARAAFGPVLVTVAEQDTTDFEKCLLRIDAPVVIAVGFTGGRLDHQFAVMNALARHSHRYVVLLGSEDCAMVVPAGGIGVALSAGTRVSLLPLAAAECSATGLRWPVDGCRLAPDGLVSVSNEATGPVSVSASGPVLISLPRSELRLLVDAAQAAVRAG